ncbi:hypothetical protein [Caulobacter sp. S45]|jgi:hypothetical protein|uniref:hypothetical protein n=1 Tax=Caulobacter sp. S45 TaxID=1641861 RepID=UPI00131B3C06|nr:hypothetical protein [Caulobacter sp. S45]
MAKLSRHLDTLAVLILACPLGGIGVALLFASLWLGLLGVFALLLLVSVLPRGREFWASVFAPAPKLTATDMVMSQSR